MNYEYSTLDRYSRLMEIPSGDRARDIEEEESFFIWITVFFLISVNLSLTTHRRRSLSTYRETLTQKIL